MRIRIVVVGKTDGGYITDGVSDYLKRISRYNPVELRVVPYLKNSKALTPEQQCQREGEQVLAALNPASEVVILDERGDNYTSCEFARWVEARMQLGIKELTFVIGGAYGFSQAVRQRASATIALSRLTFSHQMVRLIFAEQLYRAFTIIRGEPYHHQ